MKTTANGITVNYTLDGPADAPVVTLSHSLAADLAMWDPQMKALTAKYRVLRYDTRGHGGTDAPTGGYSRHSWPRIMAQLPAGTVPRRPSAAFRHTAVAVDTPAKRGLS